jgi:hypothetical protein
MRLYGNIWKKRRLAVIKEYQIKVQTYKLIIDAAVYW